jgi:protocatechuate 3,4-dioxygenase beta subunit
VAHSRAVKRVFQAMGLVLLLLLLVAGVLAFRLWRDRDEHLRLREADRTRAPVTAPKSPQAPALPSTHVAPADGLCVRGVVVDGETPLPGMQVSLGEPVPVHLARVLEACGCAACDCPEARAALFDDPRPALIDATRSITSGSDGAFVLCGLSAPVPETIWAEDATGRLATLQPLWARFQAGVPVELHLQPRLAVDGIVLREGQPVPGARVLVFPELPVQVFRATTDATGRFRLDAPHGTGRALVQAPGQAPRFVRSEVGRDGTLVLELEDPTTLEVWVTHEGRPAPGVDVIVSSAQPLRTDALGVARCEVSHRRSISVRAMKGELRASASFYPGRAVTRRLDLTLTKGVRVRGVIVDETGAPRAGIVRGALLDAALLSTTPDGRFESEPLELDERLYLTPDVQGCTAEARASVVVITQKPAEVRLAVRCGGAVQGQVVDAEGAPIARATVSVAGEGLSEDTMTDERGAFTLHLRDGAYQLRTTHPRYRSAEQPLTAPVTKALVIVLDAGGSISGRVVDQKGQGLAGAEVLAMPGVVTELFDALDGDKRLVRANAEGHYSVHGLQAGRWVVLAGIQGQPPASGAPLVLQPGEHRTGVDVTVDAKVTFRGVVMDERGAGVAAARVEWTAVMSKAEKVSVFSDTLLGRFDRLMQAVTLNTTTATDGTFTIRGLTASSVKLEVSANGFETQENTVAPSEDLRITLKAKARWTVRGRVVDERGQGVAPVEVNGSDFTSPDGRFEVEGHDDPQTMRFEAAGFISVDRTVPRAVPVAELGEVTMQRGVVLSVQVSSAQGTPLDDARVASTQEKDRASCWTAPDGVCALKALRDEETAVEVTRDGFVPKKATVPRGGFGRPLVVTLEPAGATVEAQVFGAPGVPVAGRSVSVSSSAGVRDVVSGPDGRLTVRALPEGDVCLVTKLAGGVMWAVPAVSSLKPTPVLVGPVAAGARLEVKVPGPSKVLLAASSSPPQKTFILKDFDARSVCTMSAVVSVSAPALDRLSLDGLPPGTWSIFIVPNFEDVGPDERITPKEVTLAPGESRVVE